MPCVETRLLSTQHLLLTDFSKCISLLVSMNAWWQHCSISLVSKNGHMFWFHAPLVGLRSALSCEMYFLTRFLRTCFARILGSFLSEKLAAQWPCWPWPSYTANMASPSSPEKLSVIPSLSWLDFFRSIELQIKKHATSFKWISSTIWNGLTYHWGSTPAWIGNRTV